MKRLFNTILVSALLAVSMIIACSPIPENAAEGDIVTEVGASEVVNNTSVDTGGLREVDGANENTISLTQTATTSLTSLIEGQNGIKSIALHGEVVAFDFPLDDSSLDNAFTLSPLQVVHAEEILLQEVYRHSVGSVVHISTFVNNVPLGSGSGWVWDANGHIVTNRHVVVNTNLITGGLSPSFRNEDTDIVVKFSDEREYKAKILGSDTDSDLAVLKIDATTEPLILGDSSSVIPGRLAIALGSPFGREFTMTTGVVSSILRSLPTTGSSFQIPTAIQTDAALNPGNSGGPLLDSSGFVIGVNTQINSQSGDNSGVGFAIPINLVKRVIPSLIDSGRHRYSYLGISGSAVSLSIREEGNIPDDVFGFIITGVTSGSAADKAGIRGDSSSSCSALGTCNLDGDIITGINGLPIRNFNTLIAYLALETSPNDEVALKIFRNGTTDIVSVILDERPTN